MGNPYEGEYFYGGYRDPGQGEPSQKRFVYDPSRDPQSCSPEKQNEIRCFLNNFREFMKEQIFLVKRPSFIEPPFFYTPRVIIQQNFVVTAGAGPTVVIDWPIADRQKLVISSVGISYDPLPLVLDQEVLFWFAKGAEEGEVGQTIPLLVDQSAAAQALTGYETGKTTMVPGSVVQPFSFAQQGINQPIRGKTRVQFCADNQGAEDLTMCVLMTIWEYWTPNADEFEGADKQT